MDFLERLITQTNALDRKISIHLNGIGGKLLTKGLRIFSFLGRETIWLLLIVFYSLIWLYPVLFINIGVAYLIGLILVVPIKTIIKRERPFREVAEIGTTGREPSSGSFPSWHAYNIVSQSIIFIPIFSSPLLLILLLLLIIIVCFSRIQLGVHYLSDVIFGILLGLIGGLITVNILNPLFLEMFSKVQEFYPTIFQNRLYTINPLLFNNIWYFLLCSLLFAAILLLGSYKSLKKLIK